MDKEQYQYRYDGPVMEFDRCVANRWTGKTYAVSEAKARNNLTFKFKKESGKSPQTKISLPGKIYKTKGGNADGLRF